ncbi:phage tail tape measure protein [Pseudomonas sp. Fl5BN2]|uniref:phage tail tape measure protein n=1 Tax=unclassified Pseudomonas TaxID=196821 RepID=UPI00137797A0|nr:MULTISPECIES: phage tail tape measure protein [unclassified Pseudomonas]NBF04706.1 phage tail tape measure protein [Pseudomonas sp. Fl5BN2]NBF10357.1 phage tail tape measure protein [Pseudomonas sp. Fl4BN1]
MAKKQKKANVSKNRQASNPVAEVATGVAVEAKALDGELTGVRLQVSKFREQMESNGLGNLNFSSLVAGAGLLTPFVSGVQAAINVENELAVIHAQTMGALDAEGAVGNTAKNLKLFDESVEKISQNLGEVLLPTVNNVVTKLQPMLTFIGEFVANNPGLVEGLAAAAVAFTVVTAAALGAATVFGVLASPLGIAAAVIAVVAGLIVANWDRIKSVLNWSPREALAKGWAAIGSFFSELWSSISNYAEVQWLRFRSIFDWSPKPLLSSLWAGVTDFFANLWLAIIGAAAKTWGGIKRLFSWSPLTLLINNWDAVTGYFSGCWERMKSGALSWFQDLKAVFAWNPLEMLSSVWSPLENYLSGLGGSLRKLASEILAQFKSLFDWSPLDMVSELWDGLPDWFAKWGERLRIVIAPIKELLGSIGKVITSASEGVQGFFGLDSSASEEAPRLSGFFGQGRDQFGGVSLLSGNLSQSSSSLLQQTAANNRTQLEGGLTVSFANAPVGLRVDQAKTNQPGLNVDSTIGYRSLSLGGSYA